MPRAKRRALRGVFTDIDDTLTSDGRLSAEAYTALQQLGEAGLRVVPVTGRPAGWCDHIARMWPVAAVVGENGAFYFRYLRGERRLDQRFAQGTAERARNRTRLDALAERILAEVPGSALASDQAYRESDLAIDYCEDVARLAPAEVQRIVALFRDQGATARVSSIHVNGWYGEFDKLHMTRILLRECFAEDLEAVRGEYLFVGDSPNDAPMFGFFPLSVGVSNVRDFAAEISPLPAYVTRGRSGAGFVELTRALLEAR